MAVCLLGNYKKIKAKWGKVMQKKNKKNKKKILLRKWTISNESQTKKSENWLLHTWMA